MRKKPEKIYSDIDMSFAKNFISGDINKKYDVAAVKQAMSNIINFNVGERLFQPRFGSQLRRMLFEPVDEIAASTIKSLIGECITNQERRVNLELVTVTPTESQDGYRIQVNYSILGIPDRQVFVTFLERLR